LQGYTNEHKENYSIEIILYKNHSTKNYKKKKKHTHLDKKGKILKKKMEIVEKKIEW